MNLQENIFGGWDVNFNLPPGQLKKLETYARENSISKDEAIRQIFMIGLQELTNPEPLFKNIDNGRIKY